MTEGRIKNNENASNAILEMAKASLQMPWPRLPERVLRGLLISAVSALFVVVMCLSAHRADRDLRLNLLQQARLAAQALDIKEVQLLSGTQADLPSPGYQRLKEQLVSIRSANRQCRFLYLLGLQPDGKIFFFVDSELPHSKDYSPPGQQFEEPTVELFRLFENKIPFVEGPVTDSWGTWVSALVPLTDPKTGALIAVLGMDVDSRAWMWEVAAHVAQPVGLLLVILVGVVSAFLATRPVGRDQTGRQWSVGPRPVLRHLIVPLAGMLILALICAGAGLYWELREELARDCKAAAANVSNDLQLVLAKQAAEMTVTAQTIAADAAGRKALRESDGARLLSIWQPVFETLRREKHITHFYFLDTRRVCLLRLHNPEKRGDRIERFTALEAERTGKCASGAELGPMGTFTLRVVLPVYEDGTLVGYVELGKEIEEALQELRSGTCAQLAVSIRKEFLRQQNWEEGMRMLGRDSEWDRLPHSVLIYASHGRLPDAYAPMADHDEAGTHARCVSRPSRDADGKSWVCSVTPLTDATGRDVGDTMVLIDVSDTQAAFERFAKLSGTLACVLLALLLGFAYVLLRRADSLISVQARELRESEESYREQFANNSAGMLLVDPADGAIIDANAAAVKFYGYPRERLQALRITDISTSPASATAQSVSADQGISGQRIHAQHRLADGSVRQVDVCISRIQTAGRAVLHVIVQDITEQRRAEESLREKHDMIVKLTAQVPGMVYQYRVYPDGRACLPFVSQGIQLLCEVSPEQAQKDVTCVSRHVHPGDQDRVAAAIHESARTLRPFHCEFRVVLPKQGARWRLSDAVPERTADGGTLWHGVISDITERKQTDSYRETFLDILQFLNGSDSLPDCIRRVLSSLKQNAGFDAVGLRLQEGDDFPYFSQQGFSEDFLLTENTLAERGADGGVCRDINGKVCLACTCGLVISGRADPACALFTRGGSFWTNDSKPLLDLSPAQDPRNHPRNVCFRLGYASVALIPVRDSERIVGLLHLNARRKGCFTLATIELLESLAAHVGTALMRKRAEAELRTSADRNRAILETAMDGFWLVDKQTRLVEVNDAYCRMSGYSKPELRALTFADLSVSAADEITSKLKRIAQHGHGERYESRHRRKDGSLFDIEASVQYQPDGEVFVIFIRDITERKRNAEELLKLQKLQSVGTLAGGIAHDFNNILLGLFGNISIARDELDKEHPSYAPLEEAEKSMSRAVRLTKQLLTFAKGGAPVKENVGLAELVEEVARFDLTGSNVSLVYHHDVDLWPADVDKGQIQQVISNIVINARQSMPNGGRLTITLTNADLPAEAVPALAPGRYIRIRVQDEGCGIEPKYLAQIFDPYFTTKQSGNGLGLATVWAIINKHGGHIGVASELCKGTTFTVYLPAAASPQSVAAKPPAAEGPSSARPAKILVLDDDDSICKLVVRMLSPCGYSVVTASDAQEAIALYKQALETGEPFDAAIMDLTIPGGPGGKDVIQDLLALDPHIRAIVSSGYAEDPIMSDPAAYGFKGTAAKPYTTRSLREAVARVLA